MTQVLQNKSLVNLYNHYIYSVQLWQQLYYYITTSNKYFVRSKVSTDEVILLTMRKSDPIVFVLKLPLQTIIMRICFGLSRYNEIRFGDQ